MEHQGFDSSTLLARVHLAPQILSQRDQPIAARLALSPRTLQRHLREAGLSFGQRMDKAPATIAAT